MVFKGEGTQRKFEESVYGNMLVFVGKVLKREEGGGYNL